MFRRWLSLLFILICLGVTTTTCWSDSVSEGIALPDDQLVALTDQINLLKIRLTQSNNQLKNLEREEKTRFSNLSVEHINNPMLEKINLDIDIAQSNVDSSDIELSEAEQTIGRIQKHIQDLENQLNILNVFGLKISHNGATNILSIKNEILVQNNLLNLEKSRTDYLQKLKDAANQALILRQAEYRHVEMVLKSQTIMRLKDEQAQSEMNFQKEQTYWLQQLNELYAQLNKAENAKSPDSEEMSKLQGQIFVANENVNLTYLQTLVARYEDQMHQYKISIAHTTSVGLLNKISDQTQSLNKQLPRVSSLLKTRIEILEKRKVILKNKTSSINTTENITALQNLQNTYQETFEHVTTLTTDLTKFHQQLDRALQQELSARQGLPGLGAPAWLDLGEELLWIPPLAFQVVKSLLATSFQAFDSLGLLAMGFLFILEIVWIGVCSFLYDYLACAVREFADHESGHINLKWLGIKLLHRTWVKFAIVVNVFGILMYMGVPSQNYDFLIQLGLIWVFFKALIIAARLILIETVQDHEGQDVRLYQRLKWMFNIGSTITILTVFLHQLPIIYEVKDLFVRLFLLYLLVVSTFLIRVWTVVPNLLLPYIDSKHKDIQRIIRLLGFSIPLMLLCNSAIGLFGYVNLVMTIGWYEGIFLCMLTAYLIVRGLLIDGMEALSHFLIRHVTNGWLWTEAILKPLDRVFRILLFLTSWALLFLIYGWDQQSPVVERLNKLIHYHIVSVLNTVITPLNIMEVAVIISLLFWAARWSREFVYRMLLSRTKDLGLRNSLAILTQYATIVIGVFICLAVLGIDFKALAFVVSAFAFGVGLGMRDLFNNFASGFLLLLERPLRVGDTVTIDNIEGEVVHIGGRAVTIRTDDHVDLLVPNAEIFSKNFINWTVRDNIVRGVIHVHINVTDNPHAVQKLIYDVLHANKEILKEPAPEVFLKEMSDGSINFELRYFLNIRQVKSRQGLKSEILADIWDVFSAHGVKPCYPHREVMVRKEMELI